MEVCEFKNKVWDYTRKICENANSVFCPVCEQYGLTIMQVRILTDLYTSGSHTIGNLANDICVAGANISAMCKKLEKMELLKRIRDTEDERVVKVDLTDKGYEIVAAIDKSLNENFLYEIEGIDKKTLDDIITGMEKLNILMEKISLR